MEKQEQELTTESRQHETPAHIIMYPCIGKSFPFRVWEYDDTYLHIFYWLDSAIYSNPLNISVWLWPLKAINANQSQDCKYWISVSVMTSFCQGNADKHKPDMIPWLIQSMHKPFFTLLIHKTPSAEEDCMISSNVRQFLIHFYRNIPGFFQGPRLWLFWSHMQPKLSKVWLNICIGRTAAPDVQQPRLQNVVMFFNIYQLSVEVCTVTFKPMSVNWHIFSRLNCNL